MFAHERISIGDTFDRLTVLEKLPYERSSGKDVFFMCRCSCGALRKVGCHSLSSGKAKSCGCLSRDRIANQSRKHGLAKRGALHPEYHIWSQMRDRCGNPDHKQWKNYGGRGITVCERWHEFANFIADMGKRPAGMSLDRKDNSAGYSRENCRWATTSQQSRNTRSNRMLEFNGTKKCLVDWATDLGINPSSLHERLSKWPIDRALSTPRRA